MRTLAKLAIVAALVILSPMTQAATDSALRSYFESVRTLTGTFVQETRDETGALIEAARGRFAIARPDRFDWRYEEPYEQRIVADGRWLWVYDVGLDQVTVRPLDEVLGVGPALLLSGDYQALKKAFRIESDEDGWIYLTPIEGQWDFQAARLRIEDGVPREIEVNDGLGQATRLELSELERNVPVAPGRFDFEPPPGVDVIAPPGFPKEGG